MSHISVMISANRRSQMAFKEDFHSCRSIFVHLDPQVSRVLSILPRKQTVFKTGFPALGQPWSCWTWVCEMPCQHEPTSSPRLQPISNRPTRIQKRGPVHSKQVTPLEATPTVVKDQSELLAHTVTPVSITPHHSELWEGFPVCKCKVKPNASLPICTTLLTAFENSDCRNMQMTYWRDSGSLWYLWATTHLQTARITRVFFTTWGGNKHE